MNSVKDVFSEITPEPVAASLGQVYKATLQAGDEVAVKAQDPVLETVSLDLYLARQLGIGLRNFAPSFVTERLDVIIC